MKQAPKIAIGIVAVIAATYFGLKGYVYYQTKSKMDEVVKQASLFAEVTYEGISSDLLKGSVSVSDLSISPRTIADVINIKEIKMQGDGPGFLFSDTSKMAQKTPEFLAVSIQGMRINLEGEIFYNYGAIGNNKPKVDAKNSAKTCEFGSSMSAKDMKALGYDELFMNASMLVKHDKNSSETSMNLDMEVEDMAEFSFEANMKGSASPMMLAMSPSAEEVRFIYSVDPEYMKGVKKYCASVLKISEDEYINTIVNASNDDFLKYYGFAPEEGIRKGINAFMRKPGEIEVRMRPSPNVNPLTIKQFRPEDIIDMMGLTLYVNSQPVTDLRMTLDKKYESKTLAKKDEKEKKAKKEKVKVTYTYQKTPISSLTKYIGARVKVKVLTTDGRQRDGVLISTNGKEAIIEQRVHGGKFSVHVPVEEIQELQVHRLQVKKPE